MGILRAPWTPNVLLWVRRDRFSTFCAATFDTPVRIMQNLLRRPLPFVLLGFLGAVLPGGVLAQAPDTKTEQVMLAPGDSVRVVVWRKPEMSGDFIVAPDGSITHPLYRTVRVGGIPFATAEANLRAFLARFEQDPQFVLEPLVRVAVSGEVGRPQVFAVRPETSIAEAVAQAGGPTSVGKRDQVRVLRRDASGRQREFYVNLLDPEGSSAMVRVHSGDQIVVDRRKSFFKDIFLPALSVVGSAASIYIVVDRARRLK
jgi:protein involved in polysaccharide export with SLBB domain